MINAYGSIISISIIVGFLLIYYLAKKENRDTEIIWDAAVWVIVLGLIGARLYHVLDYLEYYQKEPLNILYLWNGGLGIIGGIAGGIIGLLIFLRKRGLDKYFWLDITSISVPLAQTIGRSANFINRENYGTPTSLPWGQYVEESARLEEFKEFSFFHPVYFYEAILNIILFGLLYGLYLSGKVKPGKGRFFYIYLAGYSVIRFGLEFIRINTWVIHNLNVAQAVSILVILFSSYKLITKK